MSRIALCLSYPIGHMEVTSLHFLHQWIKSREAALTTRLYKYKVLLVQSPSQVSKWGGEAWKLKSSKQLTMWLLLMKRNVIFIGFWTTWFQKKITQSLIMAEKKRWLITIITDIYWVVLFVGQRRVQRNEIGLYPWKRKQCPWGNNLYLKDKQQGCKC